MSERFQYTEEDGRYVVRDSENNKIVAGIQVDRPDAKKKIEEVCADLNANIKHEPSGQ